MLNKLRYFFSAMKNTSSYLTTINNNFLDATLRHHKIIGWYRGLPVHSCIYSPGLSKPLANGLSRMFLGSLTNTQLPSIAHISVTDICNARCEHCSFFTAFDNPNKKILSTVEMKKVIKDCQDFGVNVINFVGGEPLLRPDICELISYVDKDKSSSSIYTNGFMLKKRAKELKKSGVMMVIASLDSTDPKTHDDFRKTKGLFMKVVEGLKECQKHKLLTGISTTVTHKEIENGDFEKMVLFAKKMQVNELIVYDRMPVGMYSHRADVTNKPINYVKMYEIVDKYNKRKDFPGIYTYANFRSASVFGCSAGRNYFYVSPYGEVCPCDFTAKPAGDMTKTPLQFIWMKMTMDKKRMDNGYLNHSCSKVNDK
jgi:MoaA/NifB/PqqE/SkfB family radical SAM enzyme